MITLHNFVHAHHDVAADDTNSMPPLPPQDLLLFATSPPPLSPRPLLVTTASTN
jgi:hypothetical protein